MSYRDRPIRPQSHATLTFLIATLSVVVLALGITVGWRAFDRDVDDAVADARASDMALRERLQAEEERAQQQAEADWKAGLLPIAWPKDRHLSVALYGDSLSYGMDATAEGKTFRRLAETALARRGSVDWATRAWQGARVSDLLRGLPPRPNTDLSIIELGTNDGFKQTDLPSFRRDYARLIDQIKAASPRTAVLCLGTWNSDYANYDRIIEDVCEGKGGRFAPLSADYGDIGNRGPEGRRVAFDDKVSDAGHPNDHGMRVIAYRILERLPRLVPNPPAPNGVVPGDPALAGAR